jgi:hypothetical protein
MAHFIELDPSQFGEVPVFYVNNPSCNSIAQDLLHGHGHRGPGLPTPDNGDMAIISKGINFSVDPEIFPFQLQVSFDGFDGIHCSQGMVKDFHPIASELLEGSTLCHGLLRSLDGLGILCGGDYLGVR